MLMVCSVLLCFLITLKELVSSLQSKTDGTETKDKETSKLSEGQIKQEVPVIDHDVIIKLEAENEQLKVESHDIGFEGFFEISMFPLDNLYLIKHTLFLRRWSVHWRRKSMP